MAVDKKHCENCGKDITEAQEYCPHCGVIVPDETEREREKAPEAVRIAEAMAPPPITTETVPLPPGVPLRTRIAGWLRRLFGKRV
jgi:predicted nucleic acid-binding Zn ribbon protein